MPLMAERADKDIKREMQLAAYEHDLSMAAKTEDIVKMYLQKGADPQYISMRYGIDLERCRRYVAALTKQKEEQRERENAMRNGHATPQKERESDAA